MEPRSLTFEAIGTHWQIDLFDELTDVAFASIQQAITERIEFFDLAYSRFRPDSLVTRMSEKAGTYELPADAKPMLDLYERLYGLTNGVFTPLIGRTLEDAGYDANYSLKPKTVIRPPQAWDEVLEYRFPTITLKAPALLDFGAAGKGYLIDLIGELLLANGVRSFLIDAGGDMFHRGPTPVRIGLEDPEQPGRVVGVATIQNESICGSAGNRRTWGDYHHTIDPRTLTSPKQILATWVVAGSAMLGDALATCVFLLPPAILAKDFHFQYAVMDQDRRVDLSQNAHMELFTS